MHPYLGLSKSIIYSQNAVRGRESSEEPITTNTHTVILHQSGDRDIGFCFFTKVVTGISVFLILFQ